MFIQNGEISDISGEFEIAKLDTNNMFKQLTQFTRDDLTQRRPSDMVNMNDIPDFPQRLNDSNLTALQLLSGRNYQEIPSREDDDPSNLAILQQSPEADRVLTLGTLGNRFHVH